MAGGEAFQYRYRVSCGDLYHHNNMSTNPFVLAISHQKAEQATMTGSPYASAKLWVYPATEEDGEVRGFSQYQYAPNKYYCQLKAETHISSSIHPGDYHPEMGYSLFDLIKLPRLQRMYKTLSHIDRKIDKLVHPNYPDTFGKWCLIFAKALNCKKYWVWHSFPNGQYLEPAQVVPWIDAKMNELHQQCLILTDKYEGEVLAYTNAPPGYDSFDTQTIATTPYCDTKGNPYRQIAIQGINWRWQTGRYYSGNYQVHNPTEWETLNKQLQPQT